MMTRIGGLEDSIMVNKDIFLQIHRSYIINLKHIKYIEGNRLKIGDTMLPISQTYRNGLLERWASQWICNISLKCILLTFISFGKTVRKRQIFVNLKHQPTFFCIFDTYSLFFIFEGCHEATILIENALFSKK